MRVHFFTYLLVSKMQQEAFLLSAWFHPPTLFWLKKGQLSKIPTYLVTYRQGIFGAWCELSDRTIPCPKAGMRGRNSWTDQAPGHGELHVWVYTYKTGGLQVYGILCKNWSRNLLDLLALKCATVLMARGVLGDWESRILNSK